MVDDFVCFSRIVLVTAVAWAVIGSGVCVAVVAYNWGFDNGRKGK